MSETMDVIEEVTPRRVLTGSMSHNFTLTSLSDVEEFIASKMYRNAIELLDDFILTPRINDISTCRTLRSSVRYASNFWYTTTCYLSGKIIMLFFTMLRLFSVDIIGIKSKSQMTVLWLIIEKMLWEVMTTNNIKHGSNPPSLLMLGQPLRTSLGDFIRYISKDEYNNIQRNLLYLTSVSRGEVERSMIVNNIVDILSTTVTPDVECGFINSIIPIIAGISISTLNNGIPDEIIHWFTFVINTETGMIYIYSSWADGEHNIQSSMAKVDVDITDFNYMLDIFKFGSNDITIINNTISIITKYFFSNARYDSKVITDYLTRIFVRDSVGIISGKFNIVMFPNYYKHCINISKLLLDTSLKTDHVKETLNSVIKTSNYLYYDAELAKFKLLLIFLYTKMGCSNSIFYQEEYLDINGGKKRRIKRKTIKRKTIKRRRRFTRRYKKR
jgi:hypothetical protein